MPNTMAIFGGIQSQVSAGGDLHEKTVAYKSRVEADGGIVYDVAWTDLVVRLAVDAGWYDDIWLFVDVCMGRKTSMDGSDERIDRLYDIGEGDNDAWATGTTRPILDSLGGRNTAFMDTSGGNRFATSSTRSGYTGADLTYLCGLETLSTEQGLLGSMSGNSRGFTHQGNTTTRRLRFRSSGTDFATTNNNYNNTTFPAEEKYIIGMRWEPDSFVRRKYMNESQTASPTGGGEAWINSLGEWGDALGRGHYFMWGHLNEMISLGAYQDLVAAYRTYHGLYPDQT